MPETPRFYVSQRKFKQARETFAWIGKFNGLDEKTIKERLAEITFEGE
jgi:hypothetical protein